MPTSEQNQQNEDQGKCQARTEVYSRVCGFYRPVQQWNKGKQDEFGERREYVVGEKHNDGSQEEPEEESFGPGM
jgi:ribonucleoside-triphosphate reductase